MKCPSKCPDDLCKWYSPTPRYGSLLIHRPCKFLTKRGKPSKDCPKVMKEEIVYLKDDIIERVRQCEIYSGVVGIGGAKR
jgi:hypothetical protein